MQCFWEQTGVHGPLRLLGKGLDGAGIAKKLNLPELTVQSCIAGMVHS
jgi:DNA-binding NarL/FixJ family response regulator